MSHICETTKCGKEATLQCPTCLKLGIPGSYFCSQPCFKGFWKEHKLIHAVIAGLCNKILYRYVNVYDKISSRWRSAYR